MTGLPFDDRDGFIWVDGAMVPWRSARIHVLTHGLHYASCVFEGERVYGGRVFRLADHSRRLVRSAELLGFALPFDAAEVDAATADVVERAALREGYVRPVAWLGSEDMGVSAPLARVHVAIAAWPWPAVFGDRAREAGIALEVVPWRRPPPDCAPVQAKAAGLYTIAAMNRRIAERHGFDDALMLDHRGDVAEASGANFFFVRDGTLSTPLPESVLDGITRRTVIGLARDLGMEVTERRIGLDEALAADEVFLTGTAYEVQPVRAIGKIRYPVGLVTRKLMRSYAETVRPMASACA